MSKQKALAEKLVYHRKIKGWSQKELSQSSQVTVRTIQRIEKGETDPHLQTLKMLTDALGIDVNDLIGIEDPKHEDVQKKWLLLLHATPFVGFVIPLAHLFIPLFLWIHKRDDNPLYREHGRKILNFQITMTLLFVLSFVLMFWDDPNSGLLSLTLLLSVLCYIVVVTCINIFTAIRRKKSYYPLSLPFIPREQRT